MFGPPDGEAGDPRRESMKSPTVVLAVIVAILFGALAPVHAHAQSATTQTIARWDEVPYQTFTGTLPVGVVAFHIGGVDRVVFSVNGGPSATVRAMTRNTITDVWEYT